MSIFAHPKVPLTLTLPTLTLTSFCVKTWQNTDVDDVTLAVALFDAGEFCLAHPSGKLLCERTGLKDAVVLHLEAKRKSMDDVKQQALISMSKIIKASI